MQMINIKVQKKLTVIEKCIFLDAATSLIWSVSLTQSAEIILQLARSKKE